MSITIEASAGTVHPAGIYRGKLVEVEVVEGEFGRQLKMTWTVTLKDRSEGRFVNWAPLKGSITPRSKLAGIITALRGRPVDFAGREKVDLEALVGKHALLVVQVQPRKDGSGDCNRIETVMPPEDGPDPAPSPKEPTSAQILDADSDAYDPFGGE